MNFSREEILDALGIESQGGWFLHALAGFGVGCVVGAAVALLVSPRSGRELRDEIVGRGRDLMQRGKETFAAKKEDVLGKGNPSTPGY
jgi:hypothetical protein